MTTVRQPCLRSAGVPQLGRARTGGRHGRPHQPLPRGLRALAARPGGVLGARPRRRSTGTSRPTKVFDKDAGVYGRWFVGAVCNTCYNAVDRHVRARPRRPAGDHLRLAGHRHEADVSPTPQLLARCRLLAAMLHDFGVSKGDRVILYMPMVPEAVIAMLACARIGAIHSVVFGGFAANELATRIDDAKPKVILSASCGIEAARVVPYKPLLDEAIELAQAQAAGLPDPAAAAVRGAADAGRDHDWREAVGERGQLAKTSECVPVAATDPLYILYTSGTTGIPKGVVRDNGGHMVALKWSMQNLYGVKPGEVWWCGLRHRLGGRPLLHRLRAAAPRLHVDPLRGQAGRHARRRRLLARHRRARRASRCSPRRPPSAPSRRKTPTGKLIAKYDLSKFRTLFLAGERADPPTIAMGRGDAEGAGDRPLVADRDRLVHRRQSGGPRRAAGEARLGRRCRCRATTCDIVDERATKVPRRHRSARS